MARFARQAANKWLGSPPGAALLVPLAHLAAGFERSRLPERISVFVAVAVAVDHTETKPTWPGKEAHALD